MLEGKDKGIDPKRHKKLNISLWLTNISLAVFWIGLMMAGYIKGSLTLENNLSFNEIM